MADKNGLPKEERRQYLRIQKHFILSYYDIDDPSTKHDITQLKNISLGGMCFVASHYYKPGIKIAIDLKTPYLAGTVHLTGVVLQSHEKITNILYEIRMAFHQLNPQSEFVLNKIVEYYKEGNHAKHE